MKKIIIQKFGGSSLASAESRNQAAQRVIATRNQGYEVILVVSAIGRKGDPYATDTLIDLAKEVNREINPRELDILLNCGEIISAVIMAQVFKGLGIDAIVLTGAQAGIITDDNYNEAKILKIETEKLKNCLRENKLIIVCGFQGITPDGQLTTLGRGGSDTTAAALGVALNAEYIDIFTDVDGIKTADPRIVENAKTLATITYTESCNLAQQGAKVIHPRAVEIAMQKNIPIRIKSTFTDSPGTLITNNGNNHQTVEISGQRLVTGITHMPNIAQIKVLTEQVEEQKKINLNIFKSLALANISVDFINVHPQQVLFTVKDSEIEKTIQILGTLGLKPEILEDCAKVSVVGANIAGVPGVMSSIVEALSEEDIKILQTADSHTTIWCLVRKKDMEKAIRALHKKFNLS
ncbi:MAG: aspartate kinase [Clostridia bacterium]|nr:aspartate kinase [Clostridia bacterium]